MTIIQSSDIFQILKKIIIDQLKISLDQLINHHQVKIQGDRVIIVIDIEIEIDQQLITNQCKRSINHKFPQAEVVIIYTKDKQLSNVSDLRRKQHDKVNIVNITNMIAITSCKGGVGKSTITVNIATIMANMGFRVGILDADIYGPSIPQMLGLDDRPMINNKMMIPWNKFQVKSNSMGYLIPKDRAAIWRGPMITKSLTQLIQGTEWGELDYLLIDMPPGTGDIHLSLLERYLIKGVILVSTPQEIAVAEVRRSIDMYHRIQVPIIGIIENMSYFVNPLNHDKIYIFGKEGAQSLAGSENINYLGDVPLITEIRTAADIGKPLIANDSYDFEVIENFKNIIKNIIKVLSKI